MAPTPHAPFSPPVLSAPHRLGHSRQGEIMALALPAASSTGFLPCRGIMPRFLRRRTGRPRPAEFA